MRNSFRFCKLHTDEALQLFAHNYCQSKQERDTDNKHKDEFQIPLHYLHASHVYGLFDVNKQMLAGYVIGVTQPFRLLDLLLPDSKTETLVQHKEILDKCCEVTCVWRMPEVSSIFMSRYFWPHVIFKAFRTGKRFFLGASASKGLDKFYTNGKPRTLYMGPAAQRSNLRLFYYNRWGWFCYLCYVLAIETPKRFFKKRFKK